jgi:hypothetical protein
MKNKTHVIDGVTYVESNRLAETGDKVIVVDAMHTGTFNGYKNGDVFTANRRA